MTRVVASLFVVLLWPKDYFLTMLLLLYVNCVKKKSEVVKGLSGILASSLYFEPKKKKMQTDVKNKKYQLTVLDPQSFPFPHLFHHPPIN